MSNFGWSYPAGVSGTPYDEYTPESCPVCGVANWDEEKEEFIHSSHTFCSDSCARDYVHWVDHEDEMYFRALREESLQHRNDRS